LDALGLFGMHGSYPTALSLDPERWGDTIGAMAKSLTVGIVAPCSVVPLVEFGAGAEHLRSLGFDVRVHDQVRHHHFTFAGTDEARAGAFFEYASDPAIDVVWSARGGYGASRLVPILARLTREKGKPGKKLVVGSSDM